MKRFIALLAGFAILIPAATECPKPGKTRTLMLTEG